MRLQRISIRRKIRNQNKVILTFVIWRIFELSESSDKDLVESMADAEEQQYVYVVTDGSDTAGSLAQLSDQIVIARDTIEDFNQDEEADDLTDEASNNIWSKCNSALSDLLVFLVNKYNADEVKSSQVKSQHWDKLIQEFYQFTGHQQLVSKQQIIRKWHNWKQYNKSKKKPHPFALVGNLTEDKVRSKCQMLLNKLPKENQVSYLESIGGGGGDEDTDVNLQVQALLQSLF